MLASTKAPVQTDIVTSVCLLASRIQALTFSLAGLCAGITMTFGCGAFAMV